MPDATQDPKNEAPTKEQVDALRAQLDALTAEKNKVASALEERNREAKARREEADKLAADKLASEKAAAEKAADVGKLLEIERGQRTAAETRLADLTAAAGRAEKLDRIVKAEVESLEKQLGDEAKAFAHLDPADRLPVLRAFAGKAQGAPRAAAPQTATPAQQNDNAKFRNPTREQISKFSDKELDEFNAIQAARAAGRG